MSRHTLAIMSRHGVPRQCQKQSSYQGRWILQHLKKTHCTRLDALSGGLVRVWAFQLGSNFRTSQFGRQLRARNVLELSIMRFMLMYIHTDIFYTFCSILLRYRHNFPSTSASYRSLGCDVNLIAALRRPQAPSLRQDTKHMYKN